ncbi:tetra-peptide repeat homeobox protein 1 [Solenopsis invicta]|uniref:tetra-peptide repeat homeobox protein 1 n=1 Tax=Solenopsis invicta TaxID=13686 RepID=UPI00193CBB1D|nr:tetra-peptide repeat homeobox protein 1 [Solenopsis invicta]
MLINQRNVISARGECLACPVPRPWGWRERWGPFWETIPYKSVVDTGRWQPHQPQPSRQIFLLYQQSSIVPFSVMCALVAILLVAALSVATAAPSGYLGHGAALAGPILGPAALAGPINGPSALAGPVVGPARISGAVDGGAVVTGSVAGPSVVSGSIPGHTAVVGPALGYAAPALGWPAYGGHYGAVLAGPAVGPAALAGPIAAPALIAGPSGSITAGHAGLGGIVRGYAPGHW